MSALEYSRLKTMPEELVTIAHEFSPLKANLMRTRLEADGIMCFIYGETLASVVGSPSSMGNEILIQVQSFDAIQARQILQEVEDSPRDKDEYLVKPKTKYEAQTTRAALIVAAVCYITWQVGGATGNWATGVLVGSITLAILLALTFRKSFKNSFKLRR